MYKIVASPTFKLCLKRLLHFLQIKYSSEKSQQVKNQLKASVLDNLRKNPYSSPVSDRLIELGIKDYRDLLVDEHNLIFYRINEKEKQVILLAVMDSRQSIQKLLYEVMMLS